MNWFLTLVRIAGVAFPITAPFVQLQAEFDSGIVKDKIARLEDPISYLHEDIPKVSKKIYQSLVENDSVNLEFDIDFYSNYSRAIAILNSKSFISKNNILGSSYPNGINLIEPSYIMYLCVLSEDSRKMEKLYDIVNNCQRDETLDAVSLSNSLELPKYVIRAMFEIYVKKGFGYQSGGLTKFRYTGKA